MDPITAIGLASAIVTFVDIGTKLVKRLEELSEAGDVPKAFQAVKTRLPLLLSLVERSRDGAQDLTDEAKASFEIVVRNCYEQATQLEEILNKVTVLKSESKWRRGARAVISLVEENRVQRVATALKDNVQLLTLLNVSPAEKQQELRPRMFRQGSVAPPTYAQATGQFLVPFDRDEHFVGRQPELDAIHTSFAQQQRVAVAGIGGVGKSQIAIEYTYRYKEANPSNNVFWVFGGNFSRFQQAYRRIAQAVELPQWDDPDASILQLVSDWFARAPPFLLVLDNADNMEEWWPSKYQNGASNSAQEDLTKYLPQGPTGCVLITTRDSRIATRLARQGKPILLQPMSIEDSRALFLSKAEGEPEEYSNEDAEALVSELDHLPLAISQAAAFIEENGITISDYLDALRGEDAEDYLHEEVDDRRRDYESDNCVFRTWRVSFQKLMQQKPKAADLLSVFAVLDRQSIPKLLLKDSIEFKKEFTTSIGTLQAFSLITIRANKESYQIHRLVQRFVYSFLRKSGTLEYWHALALSYVSAAYPTEIGVEEWDICDLLAPHVQLLTTREYQEQPAKLDLARILCWAADYDIERGMYDLATKRAKTSLDMFSELVAESDERRVAATWLYGRLRYYEAASDSDMSLAADLLKEALRTSKFPSMNYAESAFELAHLYYDLRVEELSLKFGEASFECWKAMEGPSSKRSLDNMHDYALELAMFGHETAAIAKWNELLALCPISHDASENTKTVFEFRTLASIAEFSGDAAVAEIFYKKLIVLCSVLYDDQHVHLFDYRLSHAEQVLRQGRLKEAIDLSKEVLLACQNKSEWQIVAGCLQTMAEACRLQGDFVAEEMHRTTCLKLHDKALGRSREETVDALEACASCFIRTGKAAQAETLLTDVITWRTAKLGHSHRDTIRAMELYAICAVAQEQDAEGEARFSDAIGRKTETDLRLVENLCVALWNQAKWADLETTSRQVMGRLQAENEVADSSSKEAARLNLAVALEQQGKAYEALAIRAEALGLEAMDKGSALPARRECACPPPGISEDRRFGRILHPRTWSA